MIISDTAINRPILTIVAMLGVDGEAQRELRAEVWEEKLRAGAKALGINLARLPTRKSATEKVTLAALMKTIHFYKILLDFDRLLIRQK